MDGRGHLFVSCSIESDSIQNWFLGVLPWRQCRLFFQDNHKEPCTQRELLSGGKMYLIHTYAKEAWPILKNSPVTNGCLKRFGQSHLNPKIGLVFVRSHFLWKTVTPHLQTFYAVLKFTLITGTVLRYITLFYTEWLLKSWLFMGFWFNISIFLSLPLK